MLQWVFGKIKASVVHLRTTDVAAGYFELEHARVRWFLSVNYNYIPEDAKLAGKRTYRSITVDGDEFEFSEGFTDLHTATYKHILEGHGFGLEEVRPCIEIVHDIRNAVLAKGSGERHPFVQKVL